jgi:hypothetical protein
MRWFKHLFRHEWVVSDTRPFKYYARIVDRKCEYPGCTATCLYDIRDQITFGVRK